MSAPLQVLLTVVLVVVGILVYDAVREEPGAVGTADSILRPAEAPAEAPGPVVGQADEVREPFAVLQGTGDDLWRAAVDQRLAEIEERVGRSVSSPASGRPGAGEAPAGEEPGSAAGADAAPGTGTPEPLTREGLKRFRSLLEAVERQRRLEKAAGKIRDYFGKLDLALTDEQMRDAVRTTLGFQERWRRTARGPVADEAAKRERREAFDSLWGEYSDRLRDVVPPAEANRILDALQNARQGDR